LKNNANLLYKPYTSKIQSFNIRDRYHVVLEDNLARQSRDNNSQTVTVSQNICHKSQKHVLYQILRKKTFLNLDFSTF